MFEQLLKLPLLVFLMGLGSAAMIVPAFYGWMIGEHYESRVFLYGALLFGFVTVFLGFSMANRRRSNRPRRHLLALLFLFVLLPLVFAVPFHQADQNSSFFDAYVEMVSALTTTGATLYQPEELARSLHLWRALVGFLGGLFIWVGAIAILSPMALGGFEVRSRLVHRVRHDSRGGVLEKTISQHSYIVDFSDRLRLYGVKLLPIYFGLTLVLWVGLVFAGDDGFVALCHAMSTLATSGISPVGGLSGSQAGYGGELLVAMFFLFALSRITFSGDDRNESITELTADPEVKLAAFVVVSLTLMLFFRHWIGALDENTEVTFLTGLKSLWGTFFTTLSFLTTTGFESPAWALAREWSGLQTPGLLLMGVALIGGGVATTAGGVKLIRVYALTKHGVREMEKLVHPNSVGGAGVEARHIRGKGAYSAWVFFMLFALSVALIMVLFSLAGEGFETAMVLTIAALSTTGPLADVVSVDPISYANLTEMSKGVLCVGMVLGRLETLAIVALVSPEVWRR